MVLQKSGEEHPLPQHFTVTIFLMGCYLVPNFSVSKMGGSGIYLNKK